VYVRVYVHVHHSHHSTPHTPAPAHYTHSPHSSSSPNHQSTAPTTSASSPYSPATTNHIYSSLPTLHTHTQAAPPPGQTKSGPCDNETQYSYYMKTNPPRSRHVPQIIYWLFLICRAWLSYACGSVGRTGG
jgi:hypothetical protein